ncbi:MAG: hypothetical protein ABI624_08075 [Casimicrobiaceae bacterium]
MSSFGDRVRVKESPETIAAGIAGMEGDVRGFTTPSITGITVIGGAPDDQAINVFLTQLSRIAGFAPTSSKSCTTTSA